MNANSTVQDHDPGFIGRYQVEGGDLIGKEL
jgi:hypothetical protein